MEIGFLHLHTTAVIIFLALLVSKVILLLVGKKALLQKLRDKTRVADMVLGGLIIITGAYLFFLKSNPEFYLYAKTFLLLAAIPLGIIGFKKEKILFALLSLLIIVYIYGIAESKSVVFKPQKFNVASVTEESSNSTPGQIIYTSLCMDCHGSDGKKQLFKAPDLTQSLLTHEQKLDVITHGKGIMQGYSKRLTDEEIGHVLNYVSNLK